MSDAPQCPFKCGDLGLQPSTERWLCLLTSCGFQGPVNDLDGSKVRRLVPMPDPGKEHQGLEAWKVSWLCQFYGDFGEWKCGVHGSWFSAFQGPPFGQCQTPDYSWRPTPPKETEMLFDVPIPEPEDRLTLGELHIVFERHGGQWRNHGIWNDHRPAGCFMDDGYSWRPTPPKETRREATLAEVFAAKPDGVNCWAEHKAKEFIYRVSDSSRSLLFSVLSYPGMTWRSVPLKEKHLTGWTLVTKAVGE